MPCPAQPPPASPTLRQLLEQLAAVDPASARVYRPGVELIEDRLAEARAQLARGEASLASVEADGSRTSWTRWEVQFSRVTSLRTELRLLGVDESSRRGVLERALFIARQGQALGRELCQDCGGTGEGPFLDGGTSCVFSSCDTCRGGGFAPAARTDVTGNAG